MGWSGLALTLPLSALAKLQALEREEEEEETTRPFQTGPKTL